MNRSLKVAIVAASISMVLAVEATGAEMPESADSEQVASEYGIYYGDGLRHMAERRFDAAVEALFRAYGLQPSAHVMELIVEAYDAMGHCDAVGRQKAFLNRRHGAQTDEVALKRCEQTAEVVIDCRDMSKTSVEIGGVRRGGCGESVRVPAGERHRVEWDQGVVAEIIELEAGAQTTIASPRHGRPDVARLPGVVAEVQPLPFDIDDAIDVPRLAPREESREYRIYESSEGLYHILAPESQDSDFDRGVEVEMICPEEAPNRDECIWLRDRGDDADTGVGEQGRYEIYVPRL